VASDSASIAARPAKLTIAAAEQQLCEAAKTASESDQIHHAMLHSGV
jgi:hypothetical protein